MIVTYDILNQDLRPWGIEVSLAISLDGVITQTEKLEFIGMETLPPQDVIELEAQKRIDRIKSEIENPLIEEMFLMKSEVENVLKGKKLIGPKETWEDFLAKQEIK